MSGPEQCVQGPSTVPEKKACCVREEAVLGPLVPDLSVAVSVFVLSYGTLGLLYLENTSFSSPSAVLCVC